MSHRSGRHFLQLPGPTNVPGRILQAIARPTIDHRGPEFQDLTRELLHGIKRIFKTQSHVFIYPGSGSGGWEAAIANTLSPGDRVLMFEQGFFVSKWAEVCRNFGLQVELRKWDLRLGVSGMAVMDALSEDVERRIKAVMVVHNETSTGVTSNLAAIRSAMDAAQHPALFMVDAVSSLAATDLRHDGWGIDVTVSGSQKGLMMPAGLSFNAVSSRALEASRVSKCPKFYWDWDALLSFNEDGFFPYTPATNLLFGLAESIRMLEEEGLEAVFDRHARFGTATRRAASVWGLENVAQNPDEYSSTATSLFVPEGVDADYLRGVILKHFDMSLGSGLGELKNRVFRIGHLGDLNALTLVGTLGGVEMGLGLAGVKHGTGGVEAAMAYLAETAAGEVR